MVGGGPPATAQESVHPTGIMSGDRVTIRYVAGDSAVAARYLGFLEGLPALAGLPDSLPAGVTVWLAADARTVDSILGGSPPEWSAASAVPSTNELVVPTFDGQLTRPGEAQRILRHEWAHLGLHQYLGELRIPRWFDEGYAEWAGGWDATEGWRLRVLLAAGGLPSLDSLSFAWPVGATEARTAYLLSATVVEYLVGASGERGLQIFLDRWREGGSFETALRTTYGVTSGRLEEDWREYVKGRYGWLFVLSRSAVFWGLLSILLVAMYGIRRRERHRRMEKLRAEELPDRPAFWLGEESDEPPDEAPDPLSR
jgi:hypothetical protein